MNTTIRKLGIIGLAALLVFGMGMGMAGLFSSADKIGYINVQRILLESDTGKKQAAEYARLRKSKDRGLKEQLAEIDTLGSQLKKERDKRKIDYIAEKLQRKNKEAKRYAANARDDLANSDARLVNEILTKMAPILKEIGKKRGYAVILKNMDDIAYLSPGVDITEEVITKLNKTK